MYYRRLADQTRLEFKSVYELLKKNDQDEQDRLEADPKTAIEPSNDDQYEEKNEHQDESNEQKEGSHEQNEESNEQTVDSNEYFTSQLDEPSNEVLNNEHNLNEGVESVKNTETEVIQHEEAKVIEDDKMVE